MPVDNDLAICTWGNGLRFMKVIINSLNKIEV